ncbi:MAG: hypothetical protein OXG78_08250 [Chloroflexi bacterium]|nr:hypothetical protein [Chloroflexota bacterium]
MRKIALLCLALLLSIIPMSNAQDDYPQCWESELTTSLVSVPFYKSYFSWLEDVETAEELVEFAKSHLPSRDRAWGINERCAEAIELAWWAQRELSLRAAYKAMDFGLRAKVDADPAVLAEYNPLRAITADSFYPDRFTELVDEQQALRDSGERRYKLKPEDGALPACTDARLASLAPLQPEYEHMIDKSSHIESHDDLVALAELQLAWREKWARRTVEPQDDGSIRYPARDGLQLVPPCREAVELLWLMNRAVADVTTGTALFWAGTDLETNPYVDIFNRNLDRTEAIFAKINSATDEPAPLPGVWYSCHDHQEEAMRARLPELSAMIDELFQVESFEHYLETAAGEIEWRGALWSSFPNCAEGIEMALALSQAAGDVSAFIAYTAAGVPAESNPFMQRLTMSDDIVESLHYGTLGASRFWQRPHRLPACSAAELDALAIVVAQYHLYRESMTDFGNMRVFVTIAESLFGWRDELPATLPACRESLEAGALMSQIADDYIALFGLTYAGYGRDTNPYFYVFQGNSEELVDLLQATAIESGPHETVWDFGGQLEACDGDELDKLSGILTEYHSVLDAGQGIDSLEALAAFGDAQIEWRRDSWPQLPNCAEAFEIGLHIYRTAGDQLLFDVPAIAEDKLADIIAGDTLLSARLSEIFAELPLKWRPQHTGQFDSHSQRCTAEQTETVATALSGFTALIGEAVNLKAEPAGLRDYVDKRIQWRRDTVSRLPRCVIVFELDALPAYDLAENIASNIPVLGAVLSGGDLLQAIVSALTDEDRTVQAVTPYSNRMPLCSDAELRGLKESLPKYAKIIDDESVSRDRLGFFGYIRQKLEWRKTIWAGMPICSEAIQLGFLIHQIASDISAVDALRLHDVADDENPYIALQSEGRTTLQRARENIAALIDSGARKQTPNSADSPLPRCTEAELNILYEYTFDRHLFPSFPEETIEALGEYIHHTLSWRAETWTPLPACRESFIFGSLASRQLGDLLSHYALEWSGVHRSQNPFFPDIRADVFDLVELTEALRKNNRRDLDRFIEDYMSRGD